MYSYQVDFRMTESDRTPISWAVEKSAAVLAAAENGVTNLRIASSEDYRTPNCLFA